MKNLYDFKKVLIVGTGGGNDICSTTPIAYRFLTNGCHVDIAGVCSPAAMHHYDAGVEKTINRVSSNARSTIFSKDEIRISFIDSLIPDLCAANGLDVQMFNLSFREGTSRLIEDLSRFVKNEGYEAIIAVDVGGDILARGPQDSTVLSPLMDFASLYVISKIDIPSFLIEFGLQTDGELRPVGCSEIIEELKSKNIILHQEKLCTDQPEINIYRSMYDGVKRIRAGNTIRLFFDTLNSQDDFEAEHRGGCRILDRKWPYHQTILLEKKYFGEMFYINLKRLAQERCMAFGFESSLEQLIKMKFILNCRTESDLLYSRLGDVNVWNGFIPPQFAEQEESMIEFGLRSLETHADVALTWASCDRKLFNGMYINSVSSFVLASRNKGKLKRVSDFVESLM